MCHYLAVLILSAHDTTNNIIGERYYNNISEIGVCS
jgi:hypothetical protein